MNNAATLETPRPHAHCTTDLLKRNAVGNPQGKPTARRIVEIPLAYCLALRTYELYRHCAFSKAAL